MTSTFEMQERELPINPQIHSIEKWDSLGHIQLIMAIEAEFGVRFITDRIPQLINQELLANEIEKSL